MTGQLGLNFAASYLGKTAWEEQAELLKAAIRHLTAKEVASECDVGHTVLQDAINDRDRKVWHPHWTHIVKAMLAKRLGDELAAELLRQITEADLLVTPFALTDGEPMSPEEEAAAAHRELLKFGEAGKAASERIKKKRSRR